MVTKAEGNSSRSAMLDNSVYTTKHYSLERGRVISPPATVSFEQGRRTDVRSPPPSSSAGQNIPSLSSLDNLSRQSLALAVSMKLVWSGSFHHLSAQFDGVLFHLYCFDECSWSLATIKALCSHESCSIPLSIVAYFLGNRYYSPGLPQGLGDVWSRPICDKQQPLQAA